MTLEKSLTFKKAYDIARAMEEARENSKSFGGSELIPESSGEYSQPRFM